MVQQLILPLNLQPHIDFQRFVATGNEEVLAQLQQLDSSPTRFFYLWGGPACGKSHLLQAVCHQRLSRQRPAFYVDFSQPDDLHPAIFDALEAYAVVCLDGIDHLAGDPAWEQALLYLYHRMNAKQNRLLVAASQSVPQTPWQLPDLQSRLQWGLTYHLVPLADGDKILALQRHARAQGLDLPYTVGRFMVMHYARNMHHLMQQLALLAQSTLQEKHRLTIPFVKRVLGHSALAAGKQ